MSLRCTVGGLVSAMSEQNKVWYLRRLDLFLSLTDEEVEAIARLLDDHEIPAGAELLRDRKRDRIYLIKQGAVRLYVGDRSRQVTLALLGPGRLFGLSTTFGEDDPAIGAVTLEPSYICFATWPKLLQLFGRHPEVMLRMTGALAEQLFFAETWVEQLRARTPRVRLADLLVELCDQFCDSVEGGSRVRFRLTQADLARMLNVSRETVSRLMAEFNETGLVKREGGSLVVRNRVALEDIARGRITA